MKKIIFLSLLLTSCCYAYSQTDTTAAHEYFAARQRQYPNQWAAGCHITIYTVPDSVMFDGKGPRFVLNSQGVIYPIATITDTSQIHLLISYKTDGCPLYNSYGDCIGTYAPSQRLTIDSIKAKPR
jgi:hypothetical protein